MSKKITLALRASVELVNEDAGELDKFKKWLDDKALEMSMALMNGKPAVVAAGIGAIWQAMRTVETMSPKNAMMAYYYAKGVVDQLMGNAQGAAEGIMNVEDLSMKLKHGRGLK